MPVNPVGNPNTVPLLGDAACIEEQELVAQPVPFATSSLQSQKAPVAPSFIGRAKEKLKNGLGVIKALCLMVYHQKTSFQSALFDAVANKDRGYVRGLITLGVDLNARLKEAQRNGRGIRTELSIACDQNDIPMMLLLLKNGAQPHLPGQSLIGHLISEKKLETAKKLIEEMPSLINERFSLESNTNLMLACKLYKKLRLNGVRNAGLTLEDKEALRKERLAPIYTFLKFLIENGAILSPNQSTQESIKELFQIALSGAPELALQLLEDGLVTLDQVDKSEANLFLIAKCGSLSLLQKFIEGTEDLDINKKDAQGLSLFYHACQNKSPEIALYMARTGRAEALFTVPQSPDSPPKHVNLLRVALKNGWSDVAEALLIHYDEEGCAQVRVKVSANLLGQESHLLNSCSSAVAEHGRTALHYAALLPAATPQASLQKLAIMQALITLGAKVDSEDVERQTPLHLVVEHGLHTECLFLLEKGASASAKNRQGKTPFQVALNARKAAMEVANEHQVKHENALENSDRVTADRYAALVQHYTTLAHNNQLCAALLIEEQDFEKPEVRSLNKLEYRLLVKEILALKTPEGKCKINPLALLTHSQGRCSAEIIKKIVEAYQAEGGDLKALDNNQASLVDYALEGEAYDLAVNLWHQGVPLNLEGVSNFKKMAEKFITAPFPEGSDHKKLDSFVFEAAKRGDVEILRLLADHDVDVAQYNEKGLFALHAAAEHGQLAAVKFFLEEKQIPYERPNPQGVLTPALHSALSVAHLEKTLEDRKIMVKDAPEVLQKKQEVVTYLIERFYTIESLNKLCDEDGNTALHAAVWYGNVPAFHALQARMNSNIQLQVRNKSKSNLLHLLCRAPQNEDHYELAKYLIEKGPGLKEQANMRNQTPKSLQTDNKVKNERIDELLLLSAVERGVIEAGRDIAGMVGSALSGLNQVFSDAQKSEAAMTAQEVGEVAVLAAEEAVKVVQGAAQGFQNLIAGIGLWNE